MKLHGIYAIVTLGILLLGFGNPSLHAQLDEDDFESYAIGSLIAGQGSWDTWDQESCGRFRSGRHLQPRHWVGHALSSWAPTTTSFVSSMD